MLKKDFPLVTVIIPVYNRESKVLDTLINIWNNQYRPIELIVVNDGSSDNTLDVLNAFKSKYQNDTFKVKVLDQTNKGAPAARNFGFQNSEGDYIQFLDSDDFINELKFVIQIDIMQKENADLGLCDFTMKLLEENKTVYHSNAEKLEKVIKAHGSFGCGSPLQTKTLADKISWNTNLSKKQDVDYFLKAALMSKTIAYVNKSLYTYTRSINDNERISASYSKTPTVFLERIKSIRNIDVPNNHRLHKTKAILNLYFSMIKFKIKKYI